MGDSAAGGHIHQGLSLRVGNKIASVFLEERFVLMTLPDKR